MVRQGDVVPSRSLVAGVPATVKKSLEGGAAKWVEGGGQHYVDLSRDYMERLQQIDLELDEDE